MYFTSKPLTAPRQSRRLIAAQRPVVESIESRLLLSAGAIDPTFGTGGASLIDFSGVGVDIARAIVPLPNGGALVGGDSDGRFAVARYDANGALDAGFGVGGRTVFPGYRGQVNAMAVDSGGGILLAGSIVVGSTTDLGVVRFLSSGAVDSGFGVGGIALGGFTAAAAWGLAIDDSGRIVVSGEALEDFAVARFDSTGNLDGTFGSGGKVLTDIAGKDAGRGLAIDSQGRIVVVGGANLSGNGRFAVVRYQSDGWLDGGFDLDGIVTSDLTNFTDTARSVVILANDAILVGGEADIGSGLTSIGLAQFEANGQPAAAFGLGGSVVDTFSVPVRFGSMAVDSAGRVVVGGTWDEVGGSADDDLLVVRYTDAGVRQSQDRIDTGSTFEVGHGVAVGVDNNNVEHYYVVGQRVVALADADFVVARYVAGDFPTEDGSWGTTGVTLTNFAGSRSDTMRAAGVQGSGRIITVGTAATAGVGAAIAVAATDADGQLDTSFGDGGYFLFSFPDLSSFDEQSANAVTVLGDDRIMLAGNAGGEIFVMRLTADGELDESFAGTGYIRHSITGIDSAHAVAADSGRIYVAGFVFGASDLDLAVMAFDATTGALDELGFGVDGVVAIDVAGLNGDDAANALLLLPDGNLLAGGYATNEDFGLDFVLVKLDTSGELVGGFGDGGIVTTAFAGRPFSMINALAADETGDLIVAAGLAADTSGGMAVAKYDGSGALLASIVTDIGSLAIARAVAIQGDGKIVVAGEAQSSGTDMAVVRYHTDLNPDADFGNGGLVTTDFSSVDLAAGVFVQPGGRIVAAGTAGLDFVLVGYEGDGTVVEPSLEAFIDGPASGVLLQTLEFTGSAEYSGSIEDLSFTWEVLDGSTVIASGAGSSFQFTAQTLGTLSVVLTVSNGGSATATVSQSLLVTAMALADGVLSVGGTGEADSIIILRLPSGVGVLWNGQQFETFSPVTRIVVRGGSGDDTILITPLLNIPAVVYGGGGNDRISAGSAGDALFGEAGNDTVLGGAGADILVGGDGDDLIIGGAGNDILIGGMGADRLIGNANDDILVAGYTIHDADLRALEAILAEWNSPRSYSVRVNNIRDGSGSAERLNGGYFLHGDSTVFDDAAVDMLTGNQGTDWFLFNMDEGIRDRVLDLNASEFAEDLDLIMSSM